MPITTRTPDETVRFIEARVSGFHHGKVRWFVERCSTVTGSPNGDRTTAGFTAVRVAKHWPVRGSITLTRADGARFSLGLKHHRVGRSTWKITTKEAT